MSKPMTDRDHAYWFAYVRRLADALMLRDWEIFLSREQPPSDEAAASVWVDDSSRQATVRLCWREWAGYTPEQQRHYCVHELIHCHWKPIDTHLDLAEQIIGGDTMRLLRANVANAIEFATDDLSRAVAALLPLPGAEEFANG